MHRSGTSCLAGCLEELGLALGDVNRQAPHNRKGNNENPRVMELQDELLLSNGGDWDRPPQKIRWTDGHRRRLDEILAEYRGRPVFGIKDPRTLVTIDFWRSAVAEPTLVGTFRHPLAVAESLTARNGFTRERGVALWCNYNRRLLRLYQEAEFDLVSFDSEFEEYIASVRAMARGLGLGSPEASLNFFDGSLRHHLHESCAEIEGEAAEIYGALSMLAREGASSAGQRAATT